MKDSERVPPIIVVKKKKGHGGHHGGAWKVAYADFVTAMMALFIVLWIMSQNQQIREAVAAYFREPGVFTSQKKAGILTGEPLLFPKNPPITADPQEKELEKLREQGKKIGEIVASYPEFKKFRDKVEIKVTEEGMRIELIETSEGLFFDVGSAKVKKETEELLKMIAAELGKLDNEIIIEGHTDARPYITVGYSNWELSVDRANAARKILEENGLKKNQVIMVKGLADRALKNPDKPFDFSNRRVAIIVTTSKGKAEPKKEKSSIGVKLQEFK
ncbi:MAG: OmpA family protein [Desulfobacterota bacterium]|nr:OmpA family protein [Thermodesulfobacteriota bacterium]MDW8002581.1 flagellar motor protein MotB [Deltaproteobacteria bacterium]